MRGRARVKWKQCEPIHRWKIIRGDTVEVISGRSVGSRGIVKKVARNRNSVIIEGVNLVTKHVPSSAESKGGTYQKEALIHVSNVALVDPVDNKPTKVRWVFLEGGKKARQSKRSGAIIEKNEEVLVINRLKKDDGPLDTHVDHVSKVTFDINKEILEKLQ